MRDGLWIIPLMLMASCLGYDGFEERYQEKKCAEVLACSGTGDGGLCLEIDIPGSDDCDFDRGAARNCLNSAWVCNTDFVGFEYPVKPTACDNVCVNADVGASGDAI